MGPMPSAERGENERASSFPLDGNTTKAEPKSPSGALPAIYFTDVAANW